MSHPHGAATARHLGTAPERRPLAPTPTVVADEPTPTVAAILDNVDRQLSSGHPRRAMELVSHSSDSSPWFKNALGVCHLRLNHPATAVDLLRGLAVESGVYLRRTAPTIFKTNFAVALLLNDNLAGFLRALSDLHDDDHPELARLRGAVDKWTSEMTLWEKTCWYLFAIAPRPLTIDFPPGGVR